MFTLIFYIIQSACKQNKIKKAFTEHRIVELYLACFSTITTYMVINKNAVLRRSKYEKKETKHFEIQTGSSNCNNIP